MVKTALEASIVALETWIQLFAVLVAIGIVGEVGFGARIWVLHKRLQIVQHTEDLAQEETIARLNKETGDAQKAASEANERTAKAELELARLKAPRVLTESQQNELIRKLKAFPETVIAVDFEYADGEAKALAMQIFVVLGKAGWKPSIAPHSSAWSAANTIGIVVNTFGELKRGGVPIPPQRFAPAAEALSNALKEMGLLSTYPGIKKVSDNTDESVLVVVGRKPLQ